MVAHSHWQVYVWTKFLGLGSDKSCSDLLCFVPSSPCSETCKTNTRATYWYRMKVRNSLHGKKIKHQLWSQGKVLFHLRILQSSSCPFPKLNQYLPSSFNSNTWLSHLPLHWRKGSGTSWMPRYSNRNSDQPFERCIIATRKQDVIS